MAKVEVLAQSTEQTVPATLAVFDDANTKVGTLTKRWGQVLGGPLAAGVLAKPDQKLSLHVDNRKLADLWVALTWSGEI